MSWAIAAAAIGAAIYFILADFSLQRQLKADQGQIAQLTSEQARGQALMDALTSPDSTRMLLTETRRPARPSGHVTYEAKSGALAFVASDLRPLPKGKTYELWLVPSGGGAPLPAGSFQPDAQGNSSVVLPSLPAGVGARRFIVTVEEGPNAATPTLPIVMSGR